MQLNKQKILLKMQEMNIKTQKELAELLGISKSQLSNMFSEDYDPIRTNVNKLATILKLPVIELLLDDNELLVEAPFDRYSYKLDRFTDVSNIKPKRNFTVLETFAGAGGLALGLELAGLKSVGAIEWDKNAAQTLRDNRPEWNVIEGDIEEVAENLVEYIKVDDFDVLSGGYPCQSFSYAGQREGFADTRGTLFYPYSRILNEFRPKVFIAENVRGLVNHEHGKTLETMLKVFQNEGYTVYWNVLNSWNYNVAQKRERIVIIGIRDDLIEKQTVPFSFPKVQEYKPVLKDILKDVPDSEGIEYSEKKRKVMDLVPPGGCWVDLPESIAKEYMGASWFSGGGKRGMARRLSWNEPSLTLTTSPSQKQTERCHPDETRPFKVREYARIQSFPDNWNFAGGIGASYKQIGNAVPVNMAEYIGKSVVNYLNQFAD
ncbi:DNA (cytosine-5-)-methyltransferase [Lysinibacillus sphaericus]|uniref:DNA (cytosine-5-)-methyltransferase n=1 Tax=Lysinibacillus sphaericus TaxID=1421 RepID=UPI000564E373|nr:DNA (cytosine-5-)-methyltransferase [Lysinibacillus sphaericus]MBG9689923.1 modification methylase [Lysinibacillus sphaericus]QTB22407.1 DNA (cytosine-5-)-methyltransferase [Lysinibacillus sphaericus]